MNSPSQLTNVVISIHLMLVVEEGGKLYVELTPGVTTAHMCVKVLHVSLGISIVTVSVIIVSAPGSSPCCKATGFGLNENCV